jgi:hypothetical protein
MNAVRVLEECSITDAVRAHDIDSVVKLNSVVLDQAFHVRRGLP